MSARPDARDHSRALETSVATRSEYRASSVSGGRKLDSAWRPAPMTDSGRLNLRSNSRSDVARRPGVSESGSRAASAEVGDSGIPGLVLREYGRRLADAPAGSRSLRA